MVKLLSEVKSGVMTEFGTNATQIMIFLPHLCERKIKITVLMLF